MNLKNIRINKKKLNSFQIIILSFFSLILLGTLLLMLPISSRQRCVTSFPDAMFTAVSATCVTGLVVKDTATYWSLFGQTVILLLIQIGGMGVITIGLAIMMVSGKKIGLWQRSTMQESISAPQVGGIVRLTGFILKMSAIMELIGAVLLAPVFLKDFGFPKGIWYSLFHSISAFCNAGFDLLGIREPFSSLTSYRTNLYLNVIIMLLIITGGIGFLVWSDVGTYRQHFKKYSLQSKVVLLTSAILIVLPALYFFFYEYADVRFHDRFLYSLFQSVTTRTAGFNTTDLAAMDESGTAIMIILMLIGGSPGSTAGGMKTATFAVLFLAAITVFSRRNDVQCFKRRLSDETVRNAGAIFFMYLVLFFASGIIISRTEHLPLLTCLFETGSAIGTVGLTLGITSKLSALSRVILMILMFFGRVGGLTMIYAALPSSDSKHSRLPLDKISVG
ncbi:MAG: Trk family potassium uptake protein [Clostridia bacterium]|jgi:trk system potassium uptake protein TrkH|nr:Trk family potassium uptake protein [Clostridia bacterium]MBQ1554072.1 Trk family potassium uptake protein [Clostridia bacterium]MBQ4396515.1 Trk family potassium uptake protein [Clostridia bacterium]MBQ5544842.1 Trk family potassium uptake protein [Clostridia bacterium]